MLPSLHMPAEITARSKVDISRVARLFGHKFCRSAVADNTLIIKQKSTLPVSKTRQDKSLFRSLSGAYLPPVESGFVSHLLCRNLAIMDFRRTCATTIRHQLPLAPAARSARRPALLPPPRAAPGAKMNLAYATGPFSVPNCPARPSRTTEDLILYGAVGCAATVPHRAHC